MLRLLFALLPALAVSIPLTVTKYANTCSARGSAIYTSGSHTYTLPFTASISEIAASATPIAHVDVCPAYNGRNYTTPPGDSYSVLCDVSVTGAVLPNIRSRQANKTGQSSRQSCITACEENTACVALNIGPSSCEYFSNVTGTKDAPGFAALVLVKRSANFSSTASDTLWSSEPWSALWSSAYRTQRLPSASTSLLRFQRPSASYRPR